MYSKWELKIEELVRSNPGQMSKNEYLYILENILNLAPCQLLVFGLGKDSVVWNEANRGGLTVFLEDDADWFQSIKAANLGLNAFLIRYKTKLKNWGEDLIKTSYQPSYLDLELPYEVNCITPDLILVDAPAGYMSEKPGRIQSIYQASKFAVKGNKCDVLVHDCDRPADSVLSQYFLGWQNLQKQIFKTRHYRLVQTKNKLTLQHKEHNQGIVVM